MLKNYYSKMLKTYYPLLRIYVNCNRFTNLKVMKRKLLLIIPFFITAIFVTGFKLIKQKPTTEKPNIVFIIGDDISWNDFGCYGNPDVKTPNIDQLAANGQIYTNTYLTASSCSPSRTSIISGRYPHNTQSAELHTALPASLATISEELQKAGYYTAAAGKWHMGDPAKEGFDKIVTDGKLNGDGGEEYWVNLLQERPGDQPFFMWMAAIDAHRIWGPNQFSGTHKPEDITFIPPFMVDSINTRNDFSQYYDEVYRFDYYIGEVVKELKTQGVYDNTLILVMADNGRPFPRCKTRVYDSGMKTPLVIHWPEGIKSKGRGRVDALVSVIDIAPTFLQIAGLQSPASFQGKSFDKLFNNRKQEFRNYAFSEHNWHDFEALERMVVNDRYLYVLNERPQLSNEGPADSNRGLSFLDLLDRRDRGELTFAQTDVFVTPRPVEELYDRIEDPYQLNNLASTPEKQEALQQMRNIMQQWRQVTGDYTPENITPDRFERFSGKQREGEWTRGEMPGEKSGAVEINEGGPF